MEYTYKPTRDAIFTQKYVDIKTQYEDTLLPVDFTSENSTKKFMGAVSYIFQINPLLIAHMTEQKILSIPDKPKLAFHLNYIQLISCAPNIFQTVIEYIFSFGKSEEIDILISYQIKEIMLKHKTKISYIEFIKKRLWIID